MTHALPVARSGRGRARIAAAIVLATIALRCGAEITPAFPSNEDLRHFGALADPQLSPDGTRALLRVTDSTADGGKTHLWLLDVGGAAPRQLTFSPDSDKRGEDSGRWSPDGRSVLFLAHRGEGARLYELPMNGGEAQLLNLKVRPAIDASRLADALPPAKATDPPAATEELPLDIGSFSVSPDGAWIAVIAHDPETPGEKKQKEAKADAEWVDRDPHGTRLYLYRRSTQVLTPVAVPADVQGVAWSDDGARLAAVVESPNHAGDLGPANAAWQVEAADPEHPRRIDALPASVGPVAWSADGRSLVYRAQARRDAPPGYDDLYVLDLATRTTTNLSDGLDGTVNGDPIPLANGGVAEHAVHGLDLTVAIYAPGRAPPTWLHLPVASVLAVGTNTRRSGWLFVGSSGGQAPAVYYAAELAAEARRLPAPPIAPAGLRSVAAKRLQWRNEGRTIDGLLYLPPGSDGRPPPLVVQVHGGPTGAYTDRYDPFVDFLVGHGWAVLHTNPRGSTGHGAEFAAANKNDLGGADYRDIMAGVDYVLRTERVDPQRMALMGYSYGGEMAGFVEGRTDRFKAIVSGAPVIDQYSEYGTEDDSWYDRWFFGKPWEHPADAWRQSPLARVGAAKTPFLLLQGQADVTDPLGQAQEMYRALRQAGVPVSLVTYPRDDHGALARAMYGSPAREPWHGYDARRRIVTFIEAAFDGAR